MNQTNENDILTIKTKPIPGQKSGTSGLRKKVKQFQQEHYLENVIQSIFLTLADDKPLNESVLILGGDGRYYNDIAIQLTIKMAVANNLGKLIIGQNGILSTPAVSSLIRNRKATGGIILTASHNPGGPLHDFGIKMNIENGGPAPENITSRWYKHTQKIEKYFILNQSKSIPLDKINNMIIKNTEIEIIDSVDDYLKKMQSLFDFNLLKSFLSKNFPICLDAMHGVTGPYLKRIFIESLGLSSSCLRAANPKSDFNKGHPDPNLTYAYELVEIMKKDHFVFGAAFDGDGDRNMILGHNFFLNPSDSVAIIAANIESIPQFKNGLKGLARSMPTSCALDRVGNKKGIKVYQVPTGWKFFGNIMDHYQSGVLCGEESFGTGSSHIREKDGIWTVLAWLSILAVKTKEKGINLSLEQVTIDHWKEYGRNYFTRYDYENVETQAANKVMNRLAKYIQNSKKFNILSTKQYKLKFCDNFEYKDPFDKSISLHQGYRFIYENESRFIFRLSGTGSSGATIRLYVEHYEETAIKKDTQIALGSLISLALTISNLQEYTGRSKPSVIT